MYVTGAPVAGRHPLAVLSPDCSLGRGTLALGCGSKMFCLHLQAAVSRGGVLKPLKGGNKGIWAKHCLGSRKIITASQKRLLSFEYG